jgi:hypothetical protein
MVWYTGLMMDGADVVDTSWLPKDSPWLCAVASLRIDFVTGCGVVECGEVGGRLMWARQSTFYAALFVSCFEASRNVIAP